MATTLTQSILPQGDLSDPLEVWEARRDRASRRCSHVALTEGVTCENYDKALRAHAYCVGRIERSKRGGSRAR